jgi:hypothetical protein
MDSQNLIQKLEKMKFPKDSEITTGDFKSLFSNIQYRTDKTTRPRYGPRRPPTAPRRPPMAPLWPRDGPPMAP